MLQLRYGVTQKQHSKQLAHLQVHGQFHSIMVKTQIMLSMVKIIGCCYFHLLFTGKELPRMVGGYLSVYVNDCIYFCSLFFVFLPLMGVLLPHLWQYVSEDSPHLANTLYAVYYDGFLSQTKNQNYQNRLLTFCTNKLIVWLLVQVDTQPFVKK